MKDYRPHLLVLCVLAAAVLTGTHASLRNALTDLRFSWLPREATGGIVLVAIDPPSIERIGVWPWPRELHAQLIDRLEQAGASEIVFDVDFSSPSNPAADQAFADALERAGGSVVLPTFQQLVPGKGSNTTIHVNRPLPQFSDRAWAAVVNVAVEGDGLIRRYSWGDTIDGGFLPSVGALLAGQHEPNKRHAFLIDFGIGADSVPQVSYADVLRGDQAVLGRLAGKKVIIGATALELGDRFNVPNGQIIAGPLLQTLAAESLLQGRALRSSSSVASLIGVGAIMALMLLTWSRRAAGFRAGLLVCIGIGAEVGALVVQAKWPVVIDTALLQATAIGYLGALALTEIDLRGLLGRIAEKRFQRIAMSLGDGLVCTDRDGLITVWNPGAAAIFGFEPDEIVGQPFARICMTSDGNGASSAFSICALSHLALQSPGGHVLELEGRRKNGEAFPLEACFSGWQGTDGFQYGAVLRDISVRKREMERIRYLAEHDSLTGVANRTVLRDELGARFAMAKAKGGGVALLLMDLDKFKEINDSLGHACGDEVLCAVAERLSALVEENDLVARLSGDEFAILISGEHATAKAEKLAKRISLAFKSAPFAAGTRHVRIKGSIGVAIYPGDCETPDELLGNADLALYRAKARRDGSYVFFDRGIRDVLEARLSLEGELRRAVENDEFRLFYQPQVSLKDGRLRGAEALIRWSHPERGLVSPGEFMPVLHTSSISNDVALWVLQTACEQCRVWQSKGFAMRIGVNLSPSQLQAGDLAAIVASTLKATGLPPGLLKLEVTEDILLEDDERALEMFRRIQDLGARIALDDFGTGYGSMTHLKKFPINELKIDRSFVRELRAGSDDAAIVGSTITLGKQLGLSVIAEGIENRATADLLLSMGCEEGQGYYFGRPMPAAEFEMQFLSGECHSTAAAERAANAA